MSPRVFLITGCSSGFGAALAQRCLDAGAKVVATSRNPSALRFANAAPSVDYLALPLDPAGDPAQIDAVFAHTVRHFGRVDVVVNNAGYGLAGALEELSDGDVARIMDVNFMGVLRVTRVALRYMREVNRPRGGRIQQITSILGCVGKPLLSAYCASKWAVEGFTESVALELKPEWNIHLTCIEPGGFRTQWVGGNLSFRDPRAKLEAYEHLDAEQAMKAVARAQIGDPSKGAAAIYELALVEKPPLRCLLGSEAFETMRTAFREREESYRAFEDVALPVDIDGRTYETS